MGSKKIDEIQDRLEGFTDFLTVISAFEDALKKTQDIGQVKQKPAIDTPGIKST